MILLSLNHLLITLKIENFTVPLRYGCLEVCEMKTRQIFLVDRRKASPAY